MPIPLIVAAAIAAAVVLMALYLFNHLVRLKQNVKESWSDIDTELKRRYDLIPNLVETVKGYAGHERQTLEAVIQARSAAVSNSGPSPAQAGAQDALSGALRNLFAVAERYPELKANESFQQLQQQLSDTETRISQARRFYNANVRELNTAVQSFPASLIAAPLGFHPETYFETTGAERETVQVNFAKQS
jgi:LemA protein